MGIDVQDEDSETLQSHGSPEKKKKIHSMQCKALRLDNGYVTQKRGFLVDNKYLRGLALGTALCCRQLMHLQEVENVFVLFTSPKSSSYCYLLKYLV